jgi:hypothetical protein
VAWDCAEVAEERDEYGLGGCGGLCGGPCGEAQRGGVDGGVDVEAVFERDGETIEGASWSSWGGVKAFCERASFRDGDLCEAVCLSPLLSALLQKHAPSLLVKKGGIPPGAQSSQL